MSDLLWLYVLFCAFHFIKGYEVTETLILVPSGGRYDPRELWSTDTSLLVGVNDCSDDHTMAVAELGLKGTFKSSTLLNLTMYEDVRMDFYVYDFYGNEILQVGPCPWVNDTATCTSPNLVTDEYAAKDGFRLFETGTNNTQIGIYNPRHYLDLDVSGVDILIGSAGGTANMPKTGYRGCHTLPGGAETPITDNTIQKCHENCPSDLYFLLQGEKCRCTADASGFTTADESECSTLCIGNADHLCGGPSAWALFRRDEYEAFKNFYGSYTDQTELGTTTTTEVSDTGEITLSAEKYISAAKVEIEEECSLTNVYFEVEPITFTVSYNTDCSADAQDHATLVGDGTIEIFDTVKAKCVYFSAILNNYTYPRANITLYGPSGDMVAVGGLFVMKGTWTIPESSSIISSSFESSSLDISSSLEMSSTMMEMSSDDSIMPSTSMEAMTPSIDASSLLSTQDVAGDASTASVMASATAPVTTSGLSTEDTLGNSYEPTTALQMSSNTATEGLTDATSASTDSVGAPSSDGAIASSSTSGASSSSALTTTVGTTTTSPRGWLTKDGRLVVEACTCVCKQPPLRENQTLMGQAQEKAAELSEELQVDTKNLSASVRKKESASDKRTSASAGGYVACILLGSIGVLFLAADVISISSHIQIIKGNINSMLGKE